MTFPTRRVAALASRSFQDESFRDVVKEIPNSEPPHPASIFSLHYAGLLRQMNTC